MCDEIEAAPKEPLPRTQAALPLRQDYHTPTFPPINRSHAAIPQDEGQPEQAWWQRNRLEETQSTAMLDAICREVAREHFPAANQSAVGDPLWRLLRPASSDRASRFL
jgi:hypothetical protein